MDIVLDTEQVSQALYGRATKSTMNMIRRRCVDGVIKNAEKVGTKWYINATREWPHLFGEADPCGAAPHVACEPAPPPLSGITADTTIGELFAMLATIANPQDEQRI